jgi:hypothetical protein
MSDTLCPECGGKCCRADLGYSVEHMGAECYEHRCEHCQDGTKYVAPLLLWLLTQTRNKGYDTYDSCVVAAASADEAKKIHPRGDRFLDGRGRAYDDGQRIAFWEASSWVRDIEDVTATLLGIADSSIKPGVVCASFNAG